MANTIERLIEELEDYIDSCKFQPLSNTKIIVNKEEIDELIRELRTKTPEELSKYQKVVSNQQAILNDARKRADEFMAKAEAKSHEMISQNAIMQQAYAQADEVVKTAYNQAQDILTKATDEANYIRTSTVEYVDGLLAQYEEIVSNTLRTTASHYESFYSQINQYYETVVTNRMELNPPVVDTADIPAELLNAEVETPVNEGITENTINTSTIQSVPARNPEDTSVNAPVKEARNTASSSDDTDLKLDLIS